MVEVTREATRSVNLMTERQHKLSPLAFAFVTHSHSYMYGLEVWCITGPLTCYDAIYLVFMSHYVLHFGDLTYSL